MSVRHTSYFVTRGGAPPVGLAIPIAMYHRAQLNRGLRMSILKQSTAVDVLIGPFVDSTDGDTEETGLTISSADVKLSKNGQTMAGKNDVTACVHDANGMYNCELDATDTNTCGTLVLFVHESGALAVRHEFQVVEEAIYDALFAASAAGFDANGRVDIGSWLGTAAATPTVAGVPEVDITHIAGSAVSTTTAQLGVNMVQVSGDATAADNIEADYDGTGYAKTNSTIGTATTVTNQVTADVTAISGDTTAANNLEADYDGTGYAKTNSTIGTATAVTNQVTADVTAVSGDSVAADNLEADYDGTGYNKLNSTIGTCTTNTDMITTAQVNAECDTAISDAALATAANLATVDANVDDIKLGIILGTAQTGTLSTTQMTSDLTGYADDELIGRVIVWTGGTAEGQATDITDYASTNGLLTFSAVTTAPVNGDTFKIV